MSVIRLNRYFVRKTWRCYSTVATQNEEYTAVPHYPAILDTSYEKRKDRMSHSEHETIKAVKTIEEKQIKLNMPKYYGFKCYEFKENFIPYNNLHLAKHITRTHLMQHDSLADYYNDINIDIIAESIITKFQDALSIELDGYRTTFDKNGLKSQDIENIITNQIVKQLNRTLINNLVQDYSHLLDSQVDLEPRLEAFWYAGGMNPPRNVKKYRTGVGEEWRKHTENESTNRAIQYEGKPILSLRNRFPLKPFISIEAATSEHFDVPKWIYDPRVVGTKTQHKRQANVPGYWSGDPNQFGLISYHNRGHLINRNYNDFQENQEALHRQAILSSFAWLNAQANFLGFTTFNDITYPMVTQTIITNGQLWSFYSYQMNTMLIHGKHSSDNPKINICWATPELKLYEEFKDGKLIGFNPEVFKMIVKYYANVPTDRMGVNLRPYLSQDEQVIADYEDVEKRNWLEREYKFLVSNRPRFKLQFELYHWEKIYKVDHQTRPMAARRRPFELFINPFQRKLNERQAFYVPKALRPDLPKNKGRYTKEYFP